MQSELKRKFRNRIRRQSRVRYGLRGTAGKPRLCVVKTNRHLHVQLIDDEAGSTVASASTLSTDFRQTKFNRKNKTSAHELGLHIAKLAKSHNVSCAIFDRGSRKYHGTLAALADGAREGGLKL